MVLENRHTIQTAGQFDISHESICVILVDVGQKHLDIAEMYSTNLMVSILSPLEVQFKVTNHRNGEEKRPETGKIC